MNNKVLILVYVPSIEISLEFYIPINKKIGTIKQVMVSFIESEYGYTLNTVGELKLVEKETGTVLTENVIVKEKDEASNINYEDIRYIVIA